MVATREDRLDGRVIFGKMVAMFVDLVLLLVKFVAQRFFRVKMDSDEPPKAKTTKCLLETVPEANELEEEEEGDLVGFDDEEEEYKSCFSFKFEYQIPEFVSSSRDEEGEEEEEDPSVHAPEEGFSEKSTSISNCRFSPEKGFSGFVAEPEAITCSIHESFANPGEEELTESTFLSAKHLERSEDRSRANAMLSSQGERFVSRVEEDLKGSSSAENEHVMLSEDEERRSRLNEDTDLSAKHVEEHSAESIEDVVLSEEEAFDCTDEEKALSKLFSAKDFRNSFIDSIDFILSNDEPFIGRGDKFLSSKGHKRSFKELKEVLLSKNEYFISGEDDVFLKDQNIVEEKLVSVDTKTWGEKEASQGFSGFDSDSDSTSSRDGYSVRSLVVDCDSDGFLSEKDFSEEGESLMESNRFGVGVMEDIGDFEEGQSSNSKSPTNFHNSPMERASGSISQLDEVWSMNGSSELEPELELKELNEGETKESPRPSSSSSSSSSSVRIGLTDSSDDELPSSRISARTTNSASPSNRPNRVEKKEPEEELQKSEEACGEDLEAEELDELESLWEHQDLIEQLKMELKKARAVGLPTIFEESESPREIEDLKPWKIDEKFLREDPMDELHKFYKSYRERMRKFDILNYQKMYAMGFLQLKAPLQSMGSQKPLIPTVLSHLSQNLWPLGRRKPSNSASDRFIRELRVDLETVYVGQTCLSWEFLRWQYEKARELPEADPYRSRQYNQVAGEFQQFQVIARRFIENEPFQGPRLPNYVKNRCVLRNLLQVPVIKEDKMEERKKGDDGAAAAAAITSDMLEDIMEESISIFWEFIKADRDENSAVLKTLIGNQVELQDPSDYSLMADVHATLHKKEKKLKDILKTGNCLVKKFKKPKEDRSNQDLFFSQVDMKLVSRVLKMSRITTDQLVWCHMKLDKIKIVERKIHREPSFLLFPC